MNRFKKLDHPSIFYLLVPKRGQGGGGAGAHLAGSYLENIWDI